MRIVRNRNPSASEFTSLRLYRWARTTSTNPTSPITTTTTDRAVETGLNTYFRPWSYSQRIGPSAPFQSIDRVEANRRAFSRRSVIGWIARSSASSTSTYRRSRKLPTDSWRTRSAIPDSSSSPDSSRVCTRISFTVRVPSISASCRAWFGSSW